jgi:metal-responsive CopG/Arc/MetJ family transcriptional regulator
MKTTICVTLEPALVEEIDRIAEGRPRSPLVEVLLESALGLRSPTQKEG